MSLFDLLFEQRDKRLDVLLESVYDYMVAIDKNSHLEEDNGVTVKVEKIQDKHLILCIANDNYTVVVWYYNRIISARGTCWCQQLGQRRVHVARDNIGHGWPRLVTLVSCGFESAFTFNDFLPKMVKSANTAHRLSYTQDQ